MLTGVTIMTKTDFARTLAAVACTLVMSGTCLLGAVGPAQASSAPATVQRSIA